MIGRGKVATHLHLVQRHIQEWYIDFKQVKSSGDAFLIATAMKYGLTVITEESKKGEKKIPYVCKSLNVPCIDILGLCEREGWQF